MIGSGGLLFNTDEGGEGASISAEVTDAYVLRSYQDGKVTERIFLRNSRGVAAKPRFSKGGS